MQVIPHSSKKTPSDLTYTLRGKHPVSPEIQMKLTCSLTYIYSITLTKVECIKPFSHKHKQFFPSPSSRLREDKYVFTWQWIFTLFGSGGNRTSLHRSFALSGSSPGLERVNEGEHEDKKLREDCVETCSNILFHRTSAQLYDNES